MKIAKLLLFFVCLRSLSLLHAATPTLPRGASKYEAPLASPRGDAKVATRVQFEASSLTPRMKTIQVAERRKQRVSRNDHEYIEQASVEKKVYTRSELLKELERLRKYDSENQVRHDDELKGLREQFSLEKAANNLLRKQYEDEKKAKEDEQAANLTLRDQNIALQTVLDAQRAREQREKKKWVRCFCCFCK